MRLAAQVRMAAQAWMWEAWMREAQVMGPSVRVWLTVSLLKRQHDVRRESITGSKRNTLCNSQSGILQRLMLSHGIKAKLLNRNLFLHPVGPGDKMRTFVT